MSKLTGGILLMILSLFMLLGFFKANLAATGAAAIYIAFLIAVVLPFAGGITLIRSYSAHGKRFEAGKQELARRIMDSEILKLAAKKGGKLTVIEVVTELAIDSDTAGSHLEAFAKKGMADIELTESGVIVYSFYEIKHLSDKATSKGVLDA